MKSGRSQNFMDSPALMTSSSKRSRHSESIDLLLLNHSFELGRYGESIMWIEGVRHLGLDLDTLSENRQLGLA